MALAIDGTIIVLYFVTITCIGLYMGRRERSLHDFALGGRRVPWWAVMASIIAAETSAATFLGVPTEGYTKKSLAYMQLAYGLILGRIIVGYFFLKPFYDYKVYTVYDFLGIRFGPRTKAYVSALFLVMRTLASGTRLFVPALVMVLAWRMFSSGTEGVNFGQVTGTGDYLIAIIVLTLITCAYTAAGGIKAVIWTDVIQATLMFGAAIVAIVTLLYHIGGDSANLLDGLRAMGQAVPEMASLRGYVLTGFEPEVVGAWKSANGVTEMGAWDWVRMFLGSEYSLVSTLVAYTVMCVAVFGTDQDMVQRMLTAPDYKKSRRSVITAAIMDLPIFAAFALIGVLLWAYFQQNPNQRPAAPADVFGAYIMNVMPVGVRGLVLAGVFATAMGSLSAALNALATSLTNDWYIPYVRPGQSEHHYVTAARVATGIFAVLMIAIAGAFAYAKVNMPGLRIIPVVLGIAGFIVGPMLGVFLIGLFTRRRGSDRGNVLAITAGLASTVFLGGLYVEVVNLVAGAGTLVRPTWLPEIRFTWFALVGSVVVVAVGMLFRTPAERVESAWRAGEEARAGEERPVGLRG